MDSDAYYYFECACHSDEHTLKFIFDSEDIEDPEIYTTVFLNQYRNIFKRIWVALKYIFNYKCKYGHWDCFLLRHEDAPKLKKIVDKYIKLWEKIEKRNVK